MAGQQWVRLNLASSVFPFMTEFDGRSIIQPGLDQNYNYLDQIGEPIKDRGIPQSIYMHNVLPTSQGYQAVGYDLVPSSNVQNGGGPYTTFASVFELIGTDSMGNLYRSLYSANNIGAADQDRVFDLTSAPIPWVQAGGSVPTSFSGQLFTTTAFVAGSTYICKIGSTYGISASTIYQYGSAINVLTPVTLGGLDMTKIRGICASNGYLLTWDASNNIAWSNQTNPLDFVPSIATGAGGGAIQQVRGNILYCLPISGGFIIYCSENIVGATYTGNSQFPFSFQEIVGSGGVGLDLTSINSNNSTKLPSNLNHVAYQNNLPYHYVYTNGGMQQIDLKQATGVFPDITDFLAKSVFEDFDEVNNVLIELPVIRTVPIKLTSVSSRFLVISYAVLGVPGVSQDYTHALVYDSVLARWGKLKITHTSVIDLPSISNTGSSFWITADVPYKSIGFMQSSGTIYTVNMSLNSPTPTIPADGVLIFGKVQSSRNKFVSHQRTDIENVNQGDTFSAYIIPTFDGKTLQPAQIISNPPNLVINAPKMKRMAAKIACQNFMYLFKGSFNLVSLLLDYTQEGHR